jgi:hypothetical protein
MIRILPALPLSAHLSSATPLGLVLEPYMHWCLGKCWNMQQNQSQ